MLTKKNSPRVLDLNLRNCKLSTAKCSQFCTNAALSPLKETVWTSVGFTLLTSIELHEHCRCCRKPGGSHHSLRFSGSGVHMTGTCGMAPCSGPRHHSYQALPGPMRRIWIINDHQILSLRFFQGPSNFQSHHHCICWHMQLSCPARLFAVSKSLEVPYLRRSSEWHIWGLTNSQTTVNKEQ